MQRGDLQLLELSFWIGLVSTAIVLGTGLIFLLKYLVSLVF